ncbi:MAG TPA: cobalamin biosynthesis protein, partial [Acidimicrobiales bacterium]|nr:cobalamin biosynthesis protein [Acidimicrobiales bacterium]
MTVVSVSVTERGRAMAARLPFPHEHGQAADVIRERWHEVDGFVLFLATGAAVRIIAPLLHDKRHDPAVVCVDEAGQWAIALTGGHTGGANHLCRQVAALLGAEPVVTTASDAVGQSGLDVLPGFTAVGDLATVAAALLDERRVALDNPLDWPLPTMLRGLHAAASVGSPRIVITDEVGTAGPTVVLLHPASLVVGVGGSTDPNAAELADLLEQTLEDAGLARASVSELATIERRADAPALQSLGLPIRAFTAVAL